MERPLEVEILCGLPGSGKSTWAKNRIEQDPGYVIVNKDSLREMYYGKYGYRDRLESAVRAAAMAAIAGAINCGYSVIVDETNIDRAHRRELLDYVRTMWDGVKITCTMFRWNDQTLQRRLNDPRGLTPDAWRKVHDSMAAAWESPTMAEGFDGLRLIDTTQHQPATNWVQLQAAYCKSQEVPMFIPMSGMCPSCKRDMFEKEKDRQRADRIQITFCPHCHYSFCE